MSGNNEVTRITQDKWTAMRIRYLRNLQDAGQSSPNGEKLLKRLSTRLTEADFDALSTQAEQILANREYWWEDLSDSDAIEIYQR